jgi:hypothetical protein
LKNTKLLAISPKRTVIALSKKHRADCSTETLAPVRQAQPCHVNVTIGNLPQSSAAGMRSARRRGNKHWLKQS